MVYNHLHQWVGKDEDDPHSEVNGGFRKPIPPFTERCHRCGLLRPAWVPKPRDYFPYFQMFGHIYADDLELRPTAAIIGKGDKPTPAKAELAPALPESSVKIRA